MVKSAPLAVPHLGSCASSGCAWRLPAARHSRSEPQPLFAQPPPWGIDPSTSKVADFYCVFGISGAPASTVQ
eukprot:scaffold94927_cov42-Phaeocystis_antarctica.AAC.2